MKKLDDKQIEEIIKLYRNGETPSIIGKQFGIANNSVTRILKRLNVDRNQLIRVNEEVIKIIIEKYQNGISSETIGKDLNLNGTTICRILKRNNIAMRPATENKRKLKLISENYFEIIDTEDKAYFLGFLYADGNTSKDYLDKRGIVRKKKAIKICLQAEDRDILEKISMTINGEVRLRSSFGELHDGTLREYLTWVVYCKKMHQDLMRLGCPPAKTFNIRFPTSEIVPDHLLRHFVRGYFDGDGCISTTSPSHPVVDFSSNCIFIDGLIKYLTNNNIKCNRPGVNDKNPLSGNVQLTAIENIINFYHFIYDDATIFMQRKYNTFQNYFLYLKNRVNERHQDLSKYGTTYIPKYNDILLLGENIKNISDIDKEQIVNYLYNFYRNNGFPYPILNDNDLIKDFNSISNINSLTIENNKILTTYHQSGMNVVKHFSPQFYEVNCGNSNDRMSMLDTFNDDDLLKKVIRNRIDGQFNITGNMLKQGLSNSKAAYKASVYNPMIAKFIYEKFSQPDDIVYDFSMGFGQRLLAALSINHPLTYIGVDPMEKTVDGNQNLFSFFNQNVPMLNKKVKLHCIGSENYCDLQYEGKIALAYSCPPYFNIEKYENNSKQAYFNDSYIDFINVWWRKTSQNILKLLKDDGIIALNVQDMVDGFNLGKDMCNVLRECGFNLIDTYQVQISKNTVFGTKSGSHKYEPIFILQKK